ncbi:MAG: hypothetical protein ACR2JX_02805 [Mycobacteriales bacterium]
MSVESADADREVPMNDDVEVLADQIRDDPTRVARGNDGDNDARLLEDRPPHW